MKTKEILTARLNELEKLRENLEKDSGELEFIEKQIEELKVVLNEFEEIETKLNDVKNSEVSQEEDIKIKFEEALKEKERLEAELKKYQEESQVQLSEKEEQLRKLLSDIEHQNARIKTLERRNKEAEVETQAVKFREMGIPKVLIDFYKDVALSEMSSDGIIKLNEGSYKGEYNKESLIVKLFELLPSEYKLNMTQQTIDKTPDNEAEIVELASSKVKKNK